jgi:hypothetical protein
VADGRDEIVLQSLQALALADIDDHAEDEQTLAGVDRIENHLDRKFGAVLAQPGELAAAACLVGLGA